MRVTSGIKEKPRASRKEKTMSPVQKTQLDNMAERIYTDITALHYMTVSLVRTSEVQEREELDKVRQSLRAAAMRLDALLILAETHTNIEVI
jgi:hypothetical protein